MKKAVVIVVVTLFLLSSVAMAGVVNYRQSGHDSKKKSSECEYSKKIDDGKKGYGDKGDKEKGDKENDEREKGDDGKEECDD